VATPHSLLAALNARHKLSNASLKIYSSCYVYTIDFQYYVAMCLGSNAKICEIAAVFFFSLRNESVNHREIYCEFVPMYLLYTVIFPGILLYFFFIFRMHMFHNLSISRQHDVQNRDIKRFKDVF